MHQRIVYLIAGLFLLCSHAAATNYEKLLKKQPGNTELYCGWISQLLQEGDTATAEEKIAYVRKLNTPIPCVHIKQAEIALDRGYHQKAAMYYADAICQGYDVSTDTLFAQILQSEKTLLQTTLQHRLPSTKHPDEVKIALALLLPQQPKDSLSSDTDSTTTIADTLYWTLQYTRRGNARELYGQVNGLRVKLLVDSTLEQATISGVETQFLQKNNYIRDADILDNRLELILREINLGNGLILRNVRTKHIKLQEEPLILPLKLLELEGRVEMDDTTCEIRIYKPIK